MNNKIKTKKYFLKDNELEKIEEDKLSQKDIIKNIKTIVETTKPPFNVALIGKWGTGKSSTINMLLDEYKKDAENYEVHEVNVWKDDIELKSLLGSKIDISENSELSDNIELEETNNVQDEKTKFNNISDSKTNNNQKEKNIKPKQSNNKMFTLLMDMCNAVIIFVACLFLVSILFCAMEYFQNTEIYNQNSTFFVENTYVNYCDNLGPILLISLIVTIIGIIISKIGKKKNKKEIEKVEEESNDYIENIEDFKKIHDENDLIYTSENISINQPKKTIFVIEDLDKLSITKMISTLEEIKYFSKYKNCICIVLFDETIIRKAIETKNEIKSIENYNPIKTENIIDKIFQYKIYIPRISYGDIKEYTINLVKENIPNFIAEYCEIEEFERIIKNVLIYKNVTTPRHVKKLINNFINNRILASTRYKNGKLEETLIKSKKFNLQLAKVSVIQTDFYEFYNVIFKDFNYLNELTKLYNLNINELKEKYEEIDENLKPFLTSKYKPLRNFLKQTERFEIEDIETLMYLTKVETQKMFGNISVLEYIKGEENISTLSIEDISKLIKLIDKKEDLKQFTFNNFEKILEIYKNNPTDEKSFSSINEIINISNNYIDEKYYLDYLKTVAINYNFYPEKALQLFKNIEIEIPRDIMVILFEKLKENISVQTYDDSFKIIKDNCECFYEENGNVSDYVQFLVNYIALASNPNEVITELDDNFNRIGKVYELNKNIKGLQNINYDRAYAFLAKCLDNGDLDRMVYVINTILSDENSVQDCINIEEKLENYSLKDVIEYDVDYILEIEENNLEQNNSEENNDNLVENYTVIKNLLEICAIKQKELNAVDVMKVIEKALGNIKDVQYILNIYSILKKFDRMYFYEIRRDYNEIIYTSFHTGKNNAVKEAALECTRYFKTTRLFITKLTPNEEKFYSEN